MMRWVLLWNTILQIGGVSAFRIAGSLEQSAWLKAAVVIAFVAGTLVAIYRAFPEYNVRRSLLYSMSAAACFVVVYQTVGFSVAPGIVKDIAPFSVRHVAISGIVFSAMLVFYNLCCVCLTVKSANDRKKMQLS